MPKNWRAGGQGNITFFCTEGAEALIKYNNVKMPFRFSVAILQNAMIHESK